MERRKELRKKERKERDYREVRSCVLNRIPVLSVIDFSIVVGVLFPLAVIFVVIAIVIQHHSARRKRQRVQR